MPASRKTASRKSDLIFLSLLLAVFLLGLISIFKPVTLVSESENRTLATFQHFSLDDFLNNIYQNNLESALADQFLASTDLRFVHRQLINETLRLGVKTDFCENRYLRTDLDGLALYDCDALLRPLTYPNPDLEITVLENISKYSRVNSLADTYYYFINDASVFDFRNNSLTIDYPALLRANLTGNYHLSSFNFSNFSDYRENFYRTDHHWNNQGSCRGYREILDLLRVKDSPLAPVGTYNNHDIFFGSSANSLKNSDFPEDFSVYEFNLPDYNTKINGQPATYGHEADYFNHHYSDLPQNLYAWYYGNDYAEVSFDFHRPSRENLLVFSNSFSNALKKLLASHFNRTYFIDLRHYPEQFAQDFDLPAYLEQNHINKVLFLLSPTFIGDAKPNRGLEGN